MGYDDCCVRIEKLTNGFEVEIKDPEIIKANNKRDSAKGYTPYKEPWRSYAFKTSKEVVDFLTKNLDKAGAGDEFSSAFDEAAKTIKPET